MANTQISLQLSEGVVVPSQGSVSVVHGDTVTFVNPGTSPVELFFSPSASSALSPNPTVAATIAAGGDCQFAFTTSAPGAYSVFFGTSGATSPAAYPTDESTSLILQVSDLNLSFGGFNTNAKSGG